MLHDMGMQTSRHRGPFGHGEDTAVPNYADTVVAIG